MFDLTTSDALTALRQMPSISVHCCVTSPPYWGLRDYGVAGQLGQEDTPSAYIAGLVEIFAEVRRVLRDDGTAWVNIGDGYAQSGGKGRQGKSGACADRAACQPGGARERRTAAKPPGGWKAKDLLGMPWRVAFALQEAGWYLRSDIVWNKPNPMPESIKDRPTRAHEYVFLLTKSPRYYYDAAAISEPATSDAPSGNGFKRPERQTMNGRGQDDPWSDVGGRRNKRTVWTITTRPYKEAHFATFPPDLVQPCILAGCPVGGTVLDPFIGSGTTAVVAIKHGRKCVGIELNPEYAAMATERVRSECGLLLTL